MKVFGLVLALVISSTVLAKTTTATTSAPAVQTYSSSSSGENSITGVLGFSQSALAIGADYEHRMDSTMGIGGYFLHSAEKKDGANKNQLTTFGVFAPAHIFDRSKMDIYLAPGFGITMVKGLNNASDETVFGPSIKTGFSYQIAPNMDLGIQHIIITNWFTDKVAGSFQFINAALTYGF